MKKNFGILCGFIGALLLCEIVLRILPVCSLPLTSAQANEYEAKPSIANQKVRYSRGWMFQMGNNININSAGFHSAEEYVRCPNKNGVAFIGDSLIECIMVEPEFLFHATLKNILKQHNVDCGVFSFGRSNNGLADKMKLMKLAKDKFGVSKFILNFDYADIVDDKKMFDGHSFYVVNKDESIEIKYRTKKAGLEKLKNIAFVRYVFSNLAITPSSFVLKLKKSINPDEADSNAKPQTNADLSKIDTMLFNAFIKDVLSFVDNDKSSILFMMRDDITNDKLKEKLTNMGFEVLDVTACTKTSKNYELSCFYNDSHWSARGIKRICNAIEKTKFFTKIVSDESAK